MLQSLSQAWDAFDISARTKVDLDLRRSSDDWLPRLAPSPLDLGNGSFIAFWLYGAVEPLSGEHFFWQFSHVDSDCYQRFLDEFSARYPDSLNIVQVDNGRFHKAKKLRIPDNIILLFQPPYCPELNSIERLWEHLKRDLRWELFRDLNQLQTKVDELIAHLTAETVASITGYNFILEALSVANIL